jgi:predicted DsbA family dithiol-disulfide isomerase
MIGSARTAAALLTTGFLAACASSPPPTYAPRRGSLPPPATPEEALPGVDLSSLDPAQRKLAADWALSTFSYCGAPRTVSVALRQGSSCRHAPRMAKLAVRLAAAGYDRERLSKAITDYYSSFDARKRAKLEIASFGPPLGDPAAPVAIVEFSDFTCPFCQRLRPTLEKFVADRPGRVRLHFKPYAIESHVNSLEAAQTAEWARERGAFWKMHDTLFENPFATDPESLVIFAKDLGLDGDDLAAALKSDKYVARVRGSMAEAKAAGLTGTPTLFVNGRMLRAGEFTDSTLELTLEDEEEWQRNGGWVRD